MAAFRATRQWWYVIGGVLGFWVVLVLVGQYTDWVSARALLEIFFVSIIALALAVAAAGMMAFVENKQIPGAPEGHQEEMTNHGQDQDRDGQGGDAGDAQ